MAIEYEDGHAKTVRTKEEKIKRLKEQWQSFTEEQKEFIKRVIEDEPERAEELFEQIHLSQFEHQPPTPKQFLEDPYYAGDQIKSMYPKLKQDFLNIFNGDYFEVLFTGSTRYGKTFLATYGLMYEILRLSCYRKPAQAFGLAPNSTISFSLMSTTRRQARRTIFQDLKTKIKNSPFMMNKLGLDEDSFDKSRIEVDENVVVTCEKTSEDAFIGTNMFGLIMDEVNYGANAKIEKDKGINQDGDLQTRAEKIHKKAVKRVKSTFMDSGVANGVVFVISSRNTLTDFTDKRIAEAKDDPHVYVIDYKQWEPKPKDSYSDETFRVFFGGRNLKSRILEPDEDPPETNDPLAEVIEVPMDYYDEFDSDIAGALRDIAGRSVPKITPWLYQPELIKSISTDREDYHPMPRNTWISGSPLRIDWGQLCEYKEINHSSGFTDKVPQPLVNPNSIRHAHIDMSKTEDATGLCIGHIKDMVEVLVKSDIDNEEHKELRPLIYVDFILRIKAPDDGEINYDGIRSIIYSFIDKGFNIQYVSTDRYQSVDTQQQLNEKGIESETRSLDTKTDGYDILKSALKQYRISCYEYPILETELERLQRDNIKNKVDHPKNGSKDLSDALAGVAWSLTEKRPTQNAAIVDSNKKGGFTGNKNNEHPLNQWKDVGDDGSFNEKEYESDRGEDWFFDDNDNPMIIKG